MRAVAVISPYRLSSDDFVEQVLAGNIPEWRRVPVGFDEEQRPVYTWRHAVAMPSHSESLARELLVEWGAARGLVPTHSGVITDQIDLGYRGYAVEFIGERIDPVIRTRLQGTGRRFGQQLSGYEEHYEEHPEGQPGG